MKTNTCVSRNDVHSLIGERVIVRPLTFSHNVLVEIIGILHYSPATRNYVVMVSNGHDSGFVDFRFIDVQKVVLNHAHGMAAIQLGHV
jgi:hypothetical protein